MNALVPLALFGWIPVVLGLFARVPGRRAAIAGFVIGWLFLPIAAYPIEGLPDYTKTLAVCLGVFGAALLFDHRRVLALRPRVIDVPMIVWCLTPFASSLSNDLGFHDAASATFEQIVTWGLPYAIGRVYVADLAGLRELALGVMIGGLIYVPLCLFEIANGPRLHMLLYGYHQHLLPQTMRFGGWRPIVFMQHGLMVSFWMTAAALVSLWLWMTRALKQLAKVRMGVWVPILLVATVMMKSVNAWVLLVLGVALLWLIARSGSWVPIVCALAIAPVYMTARATGLWTGESLVPVASMIQAARAQSLAYRLANEEALLAKARQRPAFGWGKWGRARVHDDTGGDLAVTDSLWIIALGNHGYVGLISMITALLLPVGVFAERYRVAQWSHPAVAPGAVLALILVLYSIDSCFNAMLNPIYVVAAGGLAGCGVNRPRAVGRSGRASPVLDAIPPVSI